MNKIVTIILLVATANCYALNCEICLNEQCNAPIYLHRECSKYDVQYMMEDLANAYRRDFVAPEDLEEYECLHLETSFGENTFLLRMSLIDLKQF